MQKPTKKTPVSKCLDLSTFTVRMLGKYPANAVLTALAAKLGAAAAGLDSAQTSHTAAVKAILPTRVDVKFENFTSDRRVRLTQQKVEMADAKKSGPIATVAFPDGSTPITRLQGESQVAEMTNLVGRLAALASLWPEAEAESQAIGQCRDQYDLAIEGRTQAGKAADDLRAKRDVAKEIFLTTYAEVASRVEAEFPRDTTMQDLFFDDVRTPSTAAEAEAEAEADDSEPDAPPPAE